MKFEFRDYQYLKVQKSLKTNKFVLLLNSSKIKSNKWIEAEQDLHKLGLKYHKTYTKAARQLIKNSIFLNSRSLIRGMVLTGSLVNSHDTKKIIMNLPTIFSVLFIKLNKKIYIREQLLTLDHLHFIFCTKKLRRSLRLSTPKPELKDNYIT